jgi:hypothetical protein
MIELESELELSRPNSKSNSNSNSKIELQLELEPEPNSSNSNVRVRCMPTYDQQWTQGPVVGEIVPICREMLHPTQNYRNQGEMERINYLEGVRVWVRVWE